MMLALDRSGILSSSAPAVEAGPGKNKTDELTLRIRNWVTVWDETRTKALLRVPLKDNSALAAEDSWLHASRNSNKPNATTFDIVPRATTDDGRLAVTLEGAALFFYVSFSLSLSLSSLRMSAAHL